MKKITLTLLLTFYCFFVANAQITLVKDLLTSDGDSYPNNFLDAENFTVFTTFNNNGANIWATDGTEANTINIGENINEIFNVFQESIVFNNQLFFVVENADTGAELYKTDGTLAGTTIVKDINNGFGSTPQNFTILSNVLFFSADDGFNGSQIWKTDGTEAGTVKVTEKVVFPNNFIAFNNQLFFSAEDNVNGTQLWKSDGTDAGTTIVKMINGANSSSPQNFMIFNNQLYFTAFTDAQGSELWKTDGTEPNTVLVKDINPGNLSSDISDITINENTFLFTANDGTNGKELWKTDGTEPGTVLVKNFSGDANSTSFVGFKVLNAATTVMVLETTALGTELWKTDGTTAGSVLVKDIFPGADSSISQFSPVSPVVLNNEIYFQANDGTTGSELWKSNGTEAGTVLIKDINPDNSIENGSGLNGGLYVLNNKIVFEAFNTATNRELWVSDGTNAGTTILNDNNPGVGWGAFLQGEEVVINGQLFFNGSNGNNGFELWKTNGTQAETIQVKNIENRPDGSSPQRITKALNKIFFAANSSVFSGQRLFLTDGTLSGTKKVEENNKSAVQPRAFAEFDGKLFYYSSTSSEDLGLYFTNSTGTLTTLVKKINPNPNSIANVTSIFSANTINKMFFGADDGTNGKEVWVSDGTTANTVLLKDLTPGADGSFPVDFFEFNGEVYFMTFKKSGPNFNSQTKKLLWKTDGTEAGTLLLKEFDFKNFNSPTSFTVFNNKLYFSGFDSADSITAAFLWTTDGTVAGTELVNTTIEEPNNLVVINNALFYGGRNDAEGNELWKFDGASSTSFKNFVAGSQGGYFAFDNFKTLINGNFYFRVLENGNITIWKTDGTEAGTLEVGGQFTFTKEVAAAGDILYFSADDGVNGTELWKSDGTAAGTTMVQDLFPGEDAFNTANSSSPSGLTILGNDLYFSADSPNFGRELFKVENAILSTESIIIVKNDEFQLDVYPNPTSSTLNISLKNNNEIKKIILFNLNGQKVMDFNIIKELIDISKLSKGIYILKVKDNKSNYIKKIIKN